MQASLSYAPNDKQILFDNYRKSIDRHRRPGERKEEEWDARCSIIVHLQSTIK
jgi:hypothetical protein